MALQHKPKLRVYRELKQEIGFQKYLEYVKGAPSTLFLHVCSVQVTNGLFEELGRHAKGGGPQGCPNYEACKESVEHVLFECAVYDFQGLSFGTI